MTALEQKLLDELEQLEKARNEEREALMGYLQQLSDQQQTIIRLLSEAPKSDSLTEQLKPILSELFIGLSEKIAQSNKQLVKQIETSLREL